MKLQGYGKAALFAALVGIGLGGRAMAVDYFVNVPHDVVDSRGRVIHGIVTTGGDILDPSGQVVGHAASGTLNSSGDILDASGNVIAHISSPGSVTTVVTNGSIPIVFTDTLGAVLDNRRYELDRMISFALNNGNLSARQAGDFRSSLTRIEAAEIAAKASGGALMYDEALDIARDLDGLAANVATVSGLDPMYPLIVVQPSGAVTFAVAPNGYVATRGVGSAATKTTTIEKTVSPEGTTITQTTTVSPTVSSINVSSDQLVQAIDLRRDAIRRLIDNGLANGQMTVAQAHDLQVEMDAINREEIVDRISDNTMTYDEALVVASRLEDLNIRVANLMSAAPLRAFIIKEDGMRRIVLDPSINSVSTTTTTVHPVFADKIITTTTTTTTPDAVVGPSGNIVTIRTVQPTVMVSTLDVRRRDLEKLVHESVEKRVITRERGDLLLSELTRIRTLIVPDITYPRAVLLAQDLDVLGTQIATVVPAVPQPIIVGSRLTVVNGQIYELDDVSVRRSELEARITKDRLQGRLTASQADDLREQMNAIETLEATFRQHGGDLSLKESRILYTNFDKVASKLDRWAGKENQ